LRAFFLGATPRILQRAGSREDREHRVEVVEAAARERVPDQRHIIA
jgi:hypothetical protein